MQKCTWLYLVPLLAVWCCPLLAATSEEQPPLHSLGSGLQDEVVDKCAKEEGVNADVQVASIKFEEVSYAFYVVGFSLLVTFAKMGWHHHSNERFSSAIPESCMLIVIGAFVGGIFTYSFYSVDCNANQPFPIRFTPDLFFIYLLPPIVFQAGYFMDSRSFIENITTICIYAVIGTLWNAFAMGFTLFGLSKAGLTTSTFGNLASALVFGTITAAVDPVAVLAVFEEIHINKLLHILVFGESLLNDAVTIVLFQVLGAFANKPFVDNMATTTDTAVEVLLGIVQFFVVIVASLIIGILMGFITTFITKYTEHVHVLEPVIIFSMGYFSYILADLFAFSGIVSLIACSIVLHHYVPANISHKSLTVLKYLLKMAGIVSEMVIFLFLGLSLFDAAIHAWDTGLVLWTLLFTFVFRPIGVVVLSVIVNFFRFHKVNPKAMFIMSYSGLRGAVAFSLALTRVFEEGIDHLPEEEQLLRRRMLTAITTLVLFTVFVQGTTIKPLVELIGVSRETPRKTTMNETVHFAAFDHVTSGVELIGGYHGFNKTREFFHKVDVKYLRPIFERYPEAIDEQIIRTFRKLQLRETQEAVEKNWALEYHKEKNQETLPGLLYQEECHVPVLTQALQRAYATPHDNHQMHVLSRGDLDHREHHLERMKFHKRLHRRQSGLFRLKTTPAFDKHTLDLAEEGMDDDQETKEFNEVKREPIMRRYSSDPYLPSLVDTSPLTLSATSPAQETEL